jgi:hypothetical protein
MDARLSCAEATHPDELDEELDMFPTLSPNAVVRLPYDRLRSVDGREGASGSCRSSPPPIWAVWLVIGLYVLRHPRFRGRMPSDASNFSKRPPSRSDTNDVAYTAVHCHSAIVLVFNSSTGISRGKFQTSII